MGVNKLRAFVTGIKKTAVNFTSPVESAQEVRIVSPLGRLGSPKREAPVHFAKVRVL